MSDMKFQKIMKKTRNVKRLDISHVTKMLSDKAAEIIGRQLTLPIRSIVVLDYCFSVRHQMFLCIENRNVDMQTLHIAHFGEISSNMGFHCK